MTPNKTNRGRPKGTGLNDAAQLLAIAGLLVAQPNLKPTTAIKQLGISDPSVIRRLRDKYHSMETELIAELKAGAVSAREALPRLEQRIEALDKGARSLALAGTREVKVAAVEATPVETPVVAVIVDAVKPVDVPVATPAAVVAVPTLAAPVSAATAQVAVESLAKVTPLPRAPAFMRPSETELPSWMGVGLSLFVFSFEAQYALIGTMMQSSPFAGVLKSQAAFVEAAVAMSSRSRSVRAK
jgi:hypothetical protein